MKIAYLVHDLSDPAVLRRVRMLQAGGGETTLIGFRRSEPQRFTTAPVTDLGRTYNGRLLHRAGAALRVGFEPQDVVAAMTGAEVVMARNLEMLWIAAAARRRTLRPGRLIYECLDIHRLMLSKRLGAPLRAVERRLLDEVDMIVTSSPAFVQNYFAPVQQIERPTLLVENKLLALPGAPPRPQLHRRAGPPWRIGWFGSLRCARSLDLLCRLASAHPGQVEIVLRGRPALDEMPDFERQVSQTPGVSYGGPYAAEDLAEMYGQVHFTWAIDFFEEGLNSAMLLPNRIYEGGYFGTPALALAKVETGRWLKARGLGVLFGDIEQELPAFLADLTARDYAELEARVAAAPSETFAHDLVDCTDLVRALGGDAASERT